jgi:predicted NUDIX family NTP pyrophosphohydrolase
LLLVHPGGPFWHNKDEHAWSIPKGEFDDKEDALEAAKREAAEELGIECTGEFIPLQSLKQPSGKIVRAWALEGDFDASCVRSNTFELEWPPRSGVTRTFPEVDRAEWFAPLVAKAKIHKGQAEFIDRLLRVIGERARE